MTRNNFPGYFILLVIFSTLVYSCGTGSKASEAAESEEVLPEDIVELRADQIALAKIAFGAAELMSVGNTLKVNGVVSVAPESQATVCMPLGGFIKSIKLIPGDAVTKGQVLAVIENNDFIDIQQDYLEARNRLVYAEAEFKRHTELFENEVYSKQNLQEVTVEYHNLKAKVHALEQKLQMTGIDPAALTEENISSTVNVVSPIKGNLKSVNVNIGKYVSPVDVLFEIVNNEKLFLDLTLFEKDAGRVTEGQKAKFFINNENEEHEAIISKTGKSVSDDKTFRAYARVTSPCRNLMPGMYVSVSIEESGNQALTVPSEAVVNFDEKDYIFIFEKEKTEAGFPFTEYRMIEVQKGITTSGHTEIKLPESYDLATLKIVVKGAYNLLSAKKNAGEMAC